MAQLNSPLAIVLLVVLLLLVAYPPHIVLRIRSPWRMAAAKRWLRRFRRTQGHYSPQQRFAYIRSIDPFLWEEIIVRCFEERGYRVKRTKMTKDGGADGYVRIDGMNVVIQAKRYKGTIKRSHIHDLHRLVQSARGLDAGLFIHTGVTTGPIREIIRTQPDIDMLSGISRILTFLEGGSIHLFNREILPRK